jgi:hypothetical protein
MMKFSALNDIGCKQGDQELVRSCCSVDVRGASHVVQVDQKIPPAEKEGQFTEFVETTKQVVLSEGRCLNIRTQLPAVEKVAL